MADVDVINTAQQQALFGAIAPIIARMSQFGTGTGMFGPGGNLYGQPLFNIPGFQSLGAPQVPGFGAPGGGQGFGQGGQGGPGPYNDFLTSGPTAGGVGSGLGDSPQDSIFGSGGGGPPPGFQTPPPDWLAQGAGDNVAPAPGFEGGRAGLPGHSGFGGQGGQGFNPAISGGQNFNPLGGGQGGQGGVAPFQVPSIQNLLPTQDFFQNIAPQIREGFDFESDIGRENLLQQLGSKGQAGSVRGGLSGAAGAALGQFEAQRDAQFGQMAFNMAQPGLQAGFGAELLGSQLGFGATEDRAKTLQGQQFQANLAGFGQQAGQIGTLQGQAFNQAASPFNMLPGLIGQSLPTPTVTPEGPSSGDQWLQTGLLAAMLFGGGGGLF